jgi:hypothetical protein
MADSDFIFPGEAKPPVETGGRIYIECLFNIGMQTGASISYFFIDPQVLFRTQIGPQKK